MRDRGLVELPVPDHYRGGRMPGKALRSLLLAAAFVAAAPAAASAAVSVTGPATVSETAGTATYTVSNDPLDVPSQVTVTVAGSGASPATPGSDVGPPNPSQVSLGVGPSSATVQVPILNDTQDEANEAFTVTVGGASTTTTITDDDVTVDATPATATEGAPATVTLTPRAAPAHELRVDYATVPGAAGPADFTAVSGTVTWAAGDASAKTVVVPTTPDALDEADESLGLLLASATDTIVPAVPVTIVDDDPPPLIGAVATKTPEGASGTKTLQVLVGLAAPSGRVIHVPYATKDGTARAGSDYTATSGTLTFNPGETAKAVSIRIAGDRTTERDETLILGLGAPENATLSPAGANATVTIADDDGGGEDTRPPRLSLGTMKRATTGVRVTVGCPASEISCRGTLTLFTVANRRSPVKALRSERRLGRATYRLSGKTTKRVTVRLTASDRKLLRRGRTVRVRAFAVTTDAGGNVADTSRSATLRFG
jgi:hypothetical protein